MKVCIVGASGKLGQYLVSQALRKGYEVVCVCRRNSVYKISEYAGVVSIIPGYTNDSEVIKTAVKGCDAVLTVLVPWGVNGYATGTAKAVLKFAEPHARLIFSCGWHISKDGKDSYSIGFRLMTKLFGWIARLLRIADINDQVNACREICQSDTRWTLVRGSALEEGESQGMPVWRAHVGDPALKSNKTRRVDFAKFMLEAIDMDHLINEAPAIVSRQAPSAKAALSVVSKKS